MTIYAMASQILVAAAAIGFVTVPTSAQTTTPQKYANEVLATVGSEKVLYKDVERAFQKNLSRRSTPMWSVPRDTALEFIELYTNYRLKVANAYERKIHEDPAVISDIDNNRKLLSETWYFDEKFANARIDQLAERRTRELKIAIILTAIRNPETKEWDTVGSYNKGMALIKLLNAGADFEKLARDSSDDAETAQEGGVLPWISGGSIIKSVEDEAYRLKVDEHSAKPIVTPFGYFIIKVLKSEPRAVVSFRHILLSPKDDRDSAATEAFANKLAATLKADKSVQRAMARELGVEGADDLFSALATKYSNDPTSAPKGGSLGSKYSRSGGMESNGSRLVAEFEEGIFAIRDGEISDPVRTVFGLHIISRDSTIYPDPLRERDNAKRTYRRLYFEDDKRDLYDSLKTALGYHWNAAVLKQFSETIDTTKNSTDTSWWRAVPEPMLSSTIYVTPNGGITVGAFTDSLRQRMDMRGYTLNRAGFERAMNKIIDPIVLQQATKDMDKKYPEFADLLKEFNDGILLFKVEEQEVWSKLKFDTTDARAFYERTKNRWMTEEKYELSEIYVLTDSAAQAVSARLKKGESFAKVASETTIREGGREAKGSIGAHTAQSNALAKKVVDEKLAVGKVLGPFKNDNGYSFVRLDKVIAPSQKSFEQALNQLAPAYQDDLQKRLTNEWLSDVKKRNPVKINTATLNKIWGKK